MRSTATCPLLWLVSIVRHPVRWLKALWPVGWNWRMVLLLLVMQTLDNAIALRARRRWLGRGYSLRTELMR